MFERLQMEEDAALAADADARKRAAEKKAALTRRLELQTQMVRLGARRAGSAVLCVCVCVCVRACVRVRVHVCVCVCGGGRRTRVAPAAGRHPACNLSAHMRGATCSADPTPPHPTPPPPPRPLRLPQVAKAHIKAAEEDEKLRALELASTSEHTYMGRVHQTLRTTDPPTWHGRRKFDWNS